MKNTNKYFFADLPNELRELILLNFDNNFNRNYMNMYFSTFYEKTLAEWAKYLLEINLLNDEINNYMMPFIFGEKE